jgi:RimJ/RimL family protein N-acetyltransferase
MGPINAGQVVLRAVTEADLPIFYAHQLDAEAARMAAFPSRDRPAFMAHWARILADETNILRTIVCDGQVAGNVVSFVQSGKREVGYWVGREFWGQGIATRALAALLAEVKERPLYAHVAKHNTGSMRVLEKCGFTVAGEEKGSAR